MTFGNGPLYNLLPDRDPTEDASWTASEGPDVGSPPTGICPQCGEELCEFEGEAFCPDCLAFTLPE